MGWKGQIADTQHMLARIVALLLSLADLAERAAGAPDDRRRLALAIMRSGGAVTRDAFGLHGDPFNVSARMADGRATPPMAVPGDGPEDALALAMALRRLALFVATTAKSGLLSLTPAEGWSISIIKNSARRHDDHPHLPAAAVPLQWHDTS